MMPDQDPNAAAQTSPYDEIAPEPVEASYVILPKDNSGCQANPIDVTIKAVIIEIPPRSGRLWK
jgi:hypothetical protein